MELLQWCNIRHIQKKKKKIKTPVLLKRIIHRSKKIRGRWARASVMDRSSHSGRVWNNTPAKQTHMPLLQHTARARQASRSHALQEAENMLGTLILEKHSQFALYRENYCSYQIYIKSKNWPSKRTKHLFMNMWLATTIRKQNKS